MRVFPGSFWEHCSKWWRWLHEGHQLSGTDGHFYKLPLPSIPKCSLWDLNQGNMRDGPKEWCYSPWRSPWSSEHCELQRCPVDKPSCYHTDEGPQSWGMPAATSARNQPPFDDPAPPEAPVFTEWKSTQIMMDPPPLCRVENISGGSPCHASNVEAIWTVKVTFFLIRESNFFPPFSVPCLMLQSLNGQFCGVEGDEVFEFVFCFWNPFPSDAVWWLLRCSQHQ